MLMYINMYANTHYEATKNPLKGPLAHMGSLWGKRASVCCQESWFALACFYQGRWCNFEITPEDKYVFTRTRSIYLFQYRAVTACWCLPALGQRIYKWHNTRDRRVKPATGVDQHSQDLWILSCEMARLWRSCVHCVWGGPALGQRIYK